MTKHEILNGNTDGDTLIFVHVVSRFKSMLFKFRF